MPAITVPPRRPSHALAAGATCLALVAVLLLGGRTAARAEDTATPPSAAVRMVSGLSLTPDGKTLVFSWRGDLWQVPASGGDASRLTFHPATDSQPHVSPDGKTLAFVSNRDGPDAVYTMPITGGTPTLRTVHTEGFRLIGWHPDGDSLFVRAYHDHHWRRAERFYLRPLDPKRGLQLVFDAYGGSAAYSPDGRWIAFTREGTAWWRKQYRGSQASQVWLYDTQEATYRKLTTGDHAERWPLWAPDSKHLYVTSQETGTFNLVAIDIEKGWRRSITTFEDDGVLFPTISADGSVIVFRRLFDLWGVNPTLENTPEDAPRAIDVRHAGDPTIDPILRRTLTKAKEVAFTDDAREIAFVAGDDIWVMDTELREPQRVTATPWPKWGVVFSPDFETLYYVSAENGSPDIVAVTRADPKRYWWQNDRFESRRITDDAGTEWALSFTPDGARLAFIKGNGTLVTVKPDGSEPIRVVEGWDPPWYSFSPDGRWVAYSRDDENFNADIWIRKADGTGEAFNVSRHPDADRSPAWSPDGRILAWSGRRWRDESDLCYVWLRKEDEEAEKRDRTIEKALEKMKGRKAKSKAKPKPKAPEPKAETEEGKDGKAAAATPDPIAGTWTGRIQGDPPVPPEGLALVLTLVRAEDGSMSGSLEVSGQGETALDTLSFDAAEGKVSFTATTPVGALTGEGTVEGNRQTGTWSIPGFADGTYEVERQEATDAKPTTTPKGEGKERKEGAKEKKKEPKPVEIDFEGLEDRIHRIGIANSSERGLLWSPDGKKLAFQATVNGARGIYTVTFPDALSPKRLTTTIGEGGRWLKEGNQIAWLAGGLPALLSASGKAQSFSFRVNQSVDLRDRHAAAFDEAWRIMRDSFYDERMNNRDWDAMREKYRPMAAAALTSAELENTVDMLLGELNASHLGFSAPSRKWSRPGWREVTGHLGIRLDPTYEGEGGQGVRVASVVRGTPAWEEDHRLRVGDLIRTVDGKPATLDTWASLMTGVDPRDITLEVERRAEGQEAQTLTLVLRPTTYGRIRLHLYDEWLRASQEAVDEASEGRVGYLHVRGMNWSSFERFEAELYKVGHGKDGLIIDVRDNGGGFTTDHLLTVLTQPQHAYTIPRGGRPGYPQDRSVYASWAKPIVVLCNQNSFSNAEIFAHAIKTMKRGAIVGVATAGGVLSTGGTSVMDVGSIRLPFRGWFSPDTGEDMERRGCEPDHVVWPEPGDEAAGVDRQLDRAVAVLLEAVKAAEANALPPPRYAAEREDAKRASGASED